MALFKLIAGCFLAATEDEDKACGRNSARVSPKPKIDAQIPFGNWLTIKENWRWKIKCTLFGAEVLEN